jgi:hypothetical protein
MGLLFDMLLTGLEINLDAKLLYVPSRAVSSGPAQTITDDKLVPVSMHFEKQLVVWLLETVVGAVLERDIVGGGMGSC